MNESEARMKIVVLDACRNNPFERGFSRSSGQRGFVEMSASAGTFIVFSTQTAADGKGG